MGQRDLTKGAVFPTMCVFALPMILGNLLQQCYNIVDSWVVGRYVSSAALGAVGSAFALMTFLTSVLLGLCMGSGVVFSLCFGTRDEPRLEDGLRASCVLTAAVTALLTAVSLLGVDAIVVWMNIPAEITEMTRDYLVLVFWGIPAIALYNFFAAYLKALGNSVVPLAFLGVSTGLNIALDLLLVAVYPFGASGAAAATVIAQYVSGLGIGLYTLARDRRLRQSLRRFRIRAASLREIASYSLLTCMQQSVMNLGILMVQGLVNSFGPVVMAAFAAAVKIDSFAYAPVQDFGNAFSTYVAQNYGAGKKERISRGMKDAVLSAFVFCFLISTLVVGFAKPLMGLFLKEESAEAIAIGAGYLHIEAAFYFGIGLLFLFYGYYRAVHKPGISVVLTVISLGTRVVLAYALSSIEAVGVTGIWMSVPIGWVLADLAGAWYYFRRRE